MAKVQSIKVTGVPPIKGQAVGYGGPALAVDCPFNVTSGIPLGGGLKEADELLNAAAEQLRVVIRGDGEFEPEYLRGVHFLVSSAGALISALQRGFDEHPMAREPDGYHADPRTFGNQSAGGAT